MAKMIENLRQTILEHAKKLLYNGNYKDFSMRNIASLCGIATGTIYNYFPTKKDLLRELMTQYWKEYLVFIDRIDREEKDIFVKLRKAYEEMDRFVNAFREVWIKMNAETDSMCRHNNIVQRRDFMKVLSARLKQMLLDVEDNLSHPLQLPMDAGELADFILQSFVMMSHMHEPGYEVFDKVLRKLFDK